MPRPPSLRRLGRGDGSLGLPFHETSAEECSPVTRVNLDGVFFTFKAILPHMIERDG